MKLKKINFKTPIRTHKTHTFWGDVDIQKVLVSNKISFGEKKIYKHFIGYLYNDNKVNPLHIMIPKTSAYVKSYDGQTKWMYFLIEDDLLEKYTIIWDKVSADIKKEFDSEPVYNKIYLKNKIKSHGNKVTDFYNKKIPKLDSNHTCLAVISLDSALKKDDNYPPVFLKECKYIEKKVVRHIHNNLKEFSYSSDSLMENKLE